MSCHFNFSPIHFVSGPVDNITFVSLSLSAMGYKPYDSRVSKLLSIVEKVIFTLKKSTGAGICSPDVYFQRFFGLP